MSELRETTLASWENSRRTSLFAAHLSLLEGVEDGAQGEAAQVADAALRLEPLRKRQVGRARWKTHAFAGFIAMAAAASLLVMVNRTNPEAEITSKGGTQISLVVERKTQRFIWDQESILQSSDRINLEVVAAAPTVAFYGVYSENHGLLSTPQDIKGNLLRLSAAQPSHFSTAFELDESNENERLVVVLCDASEFDSKFSDVREFVKMSFQKTEVRLSDSVQSFCEIKKYQLRAR